MQRKLSERKGTHPFDKPLPILVDNAFREPNLPKTNIVVHLLGILGIEGTPPTAHLKKEHPQRPEVYNL